MPFCGGTEITMDFNIKELENPEILQYFSEISAIPRGSKNEKQIASYLCDFAKKNGLEYYRDQSDNVFIKKPASAGYEKAPAVMLQGHTDMVCEKVSESNHDFTKDPIKLVFDGDKVSADGTTLGADNGIAVAMSLAVLADKTLRHPKLEVLFTTDEETGLNGAAAFDYSKASAKYMINLDSESEGYACVSCSGGMRSTLSFPFLPTPLPKEFVAKRLHIGGLMGGHSGEDISKDRINGAKLLGRVLNDLSGKFPFSIALLNGGTKDNAITHDAYADLILPSYDQAFENEIEKTEKTVAKEATPSDKNLYIRLEDTKIPEYCMSLDDTKKFIAILCLAPQGVLKMSHTIENLVESSVNLGVLETNKNVVTVGFSMRSPVDSLMNSTADNIHVLASVFGGTYRDHARYPGWSYEKGTRIEDVYKESYFELCKKEPICYAIHAGLECGIIKSNMPKTEMISIGPDIFNCHTTKEYFNIPSLQRTYKVLLRMLEKLN